MKNHQQILASLVFLAAAALSGISNGATLTVTTSSDSGPGSLRATIASAGAGDTIVFDAGLNGQTITLTSGEIAISKALTITGPGASNLAISGNNSTRIFDITAASTISGLTLENGNALENSPGPAFAGEGGAIFSSANVTLSGDAFTSNHSAFVGGAVSGRNHATSFTISGCSFTNNSNDEFAGAFYNAGDATSVSQSTFTGNTAGDSGVGGAIANDGTINFDHTVISNNAGLGDGGVGGGVFSDGPVTFFECTISGNTLADGNAIGAGLYNDSTASFRNCTISGNSAGAAGQGGGIYNENDSRSTPTTSLANCTVANNTVGVGGQGAGIYVNGFTVTLNDSTVSGNSAASGGSGGGIYNNSGTVNAANTIIAVNTADTAPDFFGNLTSQGYNLIGNPSGSTGETGTDLTNVNPNLGPLQNNGGSTQTMALLPGSPAIDHGDPAFNPNSFNPAMNTDQTGGARVINGRVDIGSFEASVAHKPSIDSLTAPQTLECASHSGTSATLTAQVSDNQGHPLTVQWFVNGQLVKTDNIPGTQPTTSGTSTYTATFPDGTTGITVTLNDGQSTPVSQSTSVTVVDTTPPSITSISANPNSLSPPNHKMVAVTVSVTAIDVCDPSPTSKIVSVTSNESGSGQFQITGNLTVNLQADRNGGGNGRIYTITVQSKDASGNTASKNVTVSVPKGGK